MTRRTVLVLVSAAAVVLVAAGMAGTAGAESAADPQIDRGRYLVTVGGCNDCHTPWQMGSAGHPEPDMSRMLSGHPAGMEMPPAPQLPPGPWMATAAASMTAWAGPWGVSFTANLTPHETGLGSWTQEDFVAALRSGRHQGRGREILPPMPWFNYAQATDEDLAAIFTYLRSIPPIENRVPDPVPPAAP